MNIRQRDVKTYSQNVFSKFTAVFWS